MKTYQIIENRLNEAQYSYLLETDNSIQISHNEKLSDADEFFGSWTDNVNEFNNDTSIQLLVKEKIMKTVKMLGIGTGAGQEVDILNRDKIQEIIDNLDPYEVFRKAYRYWYRGYKSGECQLDLRSGELTGGSYSQNEMDQAVDSVNIILFRIDQNAEIEQFGHCGCEHEGADECKCDVLIDEDGDPYNIDDFDVMEDDSIQEQLNEWYCQL
jgi:hypothetical protein